MENENRLTYIDEEGNEILCEVLFTFDSEEFKKNYVLFYPIGEVDEEGNINVMAASYTEGEDGNVGELFEVQAEEEWNLIEEMLKSFAEDMEEDDCDCEDCEECDCEDCEDEEEHGHCGCGCKDHE